MPFDPSRFIPCPDRPNHWLEVDRVVPEQRTDHGRGHVEIRPEVQVLTGTVLVGKDGDTLESLIEQLNAEEMQ